MCIATLCLAHIYTSKHTNHIYRTFIHRTMVSCAQCGGIRLLYRSYRIDFEEKCSVVGDLPMPPHDRSIFSIAYMLKHPLYAMLMHASCPYVAVIDTLTHSSAGKQNHHFLNMPNVCLRIKFILIYIYSKLAENGAAQEREKNWLNKYFIADKVNSKYRRHSDDVDR